ncbi:MAG TPA: hypothetical protein VHP11_01295, partial [Tepidisphaeraceae bacterium]|nr:hypothetical protein [Tepidisphaeraceae bacterium]
EIGGLVDGAWRTDSSTSVMVPARGYVPYVIPTQTQGDWIRIKTDADVHSATAYFHYTTAPRPAQPPMFQTLPTAEQNAQRSEGLLLASEDRDLTLHFAANVLDETGKIIDSGRYVLRDDMSLHRADDPAAEKALKAQAATTQGFQVDEASVIVLDKGKRYRLPKGPDLFSRPTASGWRRATREVVTERGLMNIHGTFYELPRAGSGGLAKVRPICTHNRMIYDYASWRGMLVLSGNLVATEAGDHYVRSNDGKVGVWVGNIDDLWKLGIPRGTGGPWKDTQVQADVPSDPYLMTGYNQKTVYLSHDQTGEVKFAIEVDFAADGSWHLYDTISVPAKQTIRHVFPAGFSAHWVRVKANKDCQATAKFVYNQPQ